LSAAGERAESLFYFPAADPSTPTSVGAILLFFTTSFASSLSDSLAAPPASLLPRTLPLTELVVLMLLDMGVWGGVVNGKPTAAELVAATLGTVPSVGVGLLVMTVLGVCAWEGRVATEEADDERVGLDGRTAATGDGEGGMMVGPCFTSGGAEAVVGVAVGVAWADDVPVVLTVMGC